VIGRKVHRAALLEGAIDCIQEKGYTRTTARDIVAAAGSHLPSINYYFGSKDALMDEALVESARRWLVLLTSVAAETSTRDPWEWLRAVGAELLRASDENRPLLVAFLEARAQAERSDDLRRRLAEEIDDFRVALVRLAEPLLPPETVADSTVPEGFATLLLALADGLMTMRLLNPARGPSWDDVLGAAQLTAGATARRAGRRETRRPRASRRSPG
jgi:AcrR family transcriptional regulator